MPWDQLAKIAVPLALGAAVLYAVIALAKGTGRWKAIAKVEQAKEEAHAETEKRGEEFDAGGGLAGGIVRARRLRDARKPKP